MTWKRVATAAVLIGANLVLGTLVFTMATGIGMGLLGSLFTVFWLVSCSNVINLVDGLDGLAAGIVGIAGKMLVIDRAAVAAAADAAGLFVTGVADDG